MMLRHGSYSNRNRSKAGQEKLSPGSQIQILLGKDGSDYAYFLNERSNEGGGSNSSSGRTGSTEWAQVHDWTKTSSISGGGIPDDLFSQLNNLYKSGRFATSISFGPSGEGEYFIAGCKQSEFNEYCNTAAVAKGNGNSNSNENGCPGLTGSTYHFRWGNVSSSAREAITTAIQQKPSSCDAYKSIAGLKQVCFGMGGQWLLVSGKNQCQYSIDLDGNLKQTLERIYCQGKTIYNVKLLPKSGFFVRHSDGHEWKGCCTALDEELSKIADNGDGNDGDSGSRSGHDEVLDVVVAGDLKSWIVLRTNGFAASEGISESLIKVLTQFYDNRRETIKTHYCSTSFEEDSALLSTATTAFMGNQEKDKQPHKQEKMKQSKKPQQRSIIITTSNHRGEVSAKAADTSLNKSVSTESTKSTASGGSGGTSAASGSQPFDAVTERTPPPEAAKRDAERLRRERENGFIKNRNNNDFEKELADKNIKVGDRVTVLNASLTLGDAVLDEIIPNQGLKVSMAYTIPLIVRDPRRVLAFNKDHHNPNTSFFDNGNAETDEVFERIMMHLCWATDKYDAAKAFYANNQTDDASITEKLPETKPRVNMHVKIKAGRFDEDPAMFSVCSDDSDHLRMGNPPDDDISLVGGVITIPKNTLPSDTTVQVRPLLEHRGEVASYIDEYRCAEKVDMEALKRVISDLALDSTKRSQILTHLKSSAPLMAEYADVYNLLLRCRAIEQQARMLWRNLRNLPRDKYDCVVHVVEYEHLDASYRGRLFAKGSNSIGKTASGGENSAASIALQTLNRDLRGLLVGKFAHYVDCENSEVRIICSLATQMGLVRLIPTICDYRDNRNRWIKLLSTSHRVSERVAKHLPNFLLNGGKYETWLRASGTSKEILFSIASPQEMEAIEQFVFKLYVEGCALREQILKHPRFGWIRLERAKMIMGSLVSEESVDSLLFSRIVQSCENEVLGIIHRCFGDYEWVVRAKMFDSIITEPGKSTRMDLASVMNECEAFCLSRRWDVVLVEKPLYGLHFDPLATFVAARRAITNVPFDVTRAVEAANPGLKALVENEKWNSKVRGQ